MKKKLIMSNNTLSVIGWKEIFREISEEFCVSVEPYEEKLLKNRTGQYDIYILDTITNDDDINQRLEFIADFDEKAKVIIVGLSCEQAANIINSKLIYGLMTMNTSISEWKIALKSILSGNHYSNSIYEPVRLDIFSKKKGTFHKDDIPTKREMEIMKCISTGMSSAEIGATLSISENTVESFRKRLIMKFDARNAVDLIVKAVKIGLI